MNHPANLRKRTNVQNGEKSADSVSTVVRIRGEDIILETLNVNDIMSENDIIMKLKQELEDERSQKHIVALILQEKNKYIKDLRKMLQEKEEESKPKPNTINVRKSAEALMSSAVTFTSRRTNSNKIQIPSAFSFPSKRTHRYHF